MHDHTFVAPEPVLVVDRWPRVQRSEWASSALLQASSGRFEQVRVQGTHWVIVTEKERARAEYGREREREWTLAQPTCAY